MAVQVSRAIGVDNSICIYKIIVVVYISSCYIVERLIKNSVSCSEKLCVNSKIHLVRSDLQLEYLILETLSSKTLDNCLKPNSPTLNIILKHGNSCRMFP